MPPAIAFSNKDISEMISQYESGDSMRDIAIRFSCGKNTIRSRLIVAGVKFDKGRSLSKKLKGRPSHRKGAKHSLESRMKMSVSRAGITPTLGYKFSDGSKQKMSRARIAFLKRNPDGMRKAIEASRLVNKLPDHERIARTKVREIMKRSLHRCLKLSGRLKESRTEKMLGYSQSELREHIESQFIDDMSWENRQSFHIDHIVPIKYFIDNGITDPSVINALSNLQVLTPIDNQRKSARMEYLT